MTTAVELDDAERAALIALLKQAIAADPFPMSARNKLLRGILAKLQRPGTEGRALTPSEPANIKP